MHPWLCNSRKTRVQFLLTATVLPDCILLYEMNTKQLTITEAIALLHIHFTYFSKSDKSSHYLNVPPLVGDKWLPDCSGVSCDSQQWRLRRVRWRGCCWWMSSAPAAAEPEPSQGGGEEAGPADGSPRQTSTGNQGQEILSTQPADTISQHQQIQIQEKENEVRWCGGSECINPVQVLAVLAGAWPPAQPGHIAHIRDITYHHQSGKKCHKQGKRFCYICNR